MAASVMTFTSLSEDILRYSERPNDDRLAAQIPRIVLLAESECAADLRVLGSELVMTSAMTTGDPVVEKPAYWRSTTSMTIFTTAAGTTRRTLKKRAYEYLRSYWPDATQVGVPIYYAEYDFNHFLVAPTPNAALPFELVYQARLDPLSEDNQENWTTTTAPQLLFHSCMYHASLFLKNFDKAATWRSGYDTALTALKREDASRSTDRTIVKG